ncbi:MAG: phosphate ABC transporter permease subunit PstC [Christensenellales bacterium]|jgi:phosphate transport system permease protein
MKKLKEPLARILFFAAATVSIIAVILICVFLFANGIPGMAKIGFLDFLTGKTWRPGNDIYGILPMILGSIYVTAGAIVIGVPIGIFTAVYISRFISGKPKRIIQSAVSLLAGIPSVIYGFFGLTVILPLTRDLFRATGTGSMLAASIILGVMILPTVISVSEAAISAVPEAYYEGSLALGATHERSVFFTLLPAAKSGVTASVVLGVGRAIGETMAVIMVAGNQPRMPVSLLKGVRTLTANIVIEMGYAADLHREALIATAVVLFVFILIINLLFSLLERRSRV